MKTNTRRQFLETAAVTGATAIAAPAVAQDGKSPNDQVRIALLGLGGRMRSHVAALAEMASENVKIVAVCDCDQKKLAQARKMYPQLENLKLAFYDDMRRLFDDKSVDAVTNCLPSGCRRTYASAMGTWAFNAGTT